jgi:hypothetical protein
MLVIVPPTPQSLCMCVFPSAVLVSFKVRPVSKQSEKMCAVVLLFYRFDGGIASVFPRPRSGLGYENASFLENMSRQSVANIHAFLL